MKPRHAAAVTLLSLLGCEDALHCGEGTIQEGNECVASGGSGGAATTATSVASATIASTSVASTTMASTTAVASTTASVGTGGSGGTGIDPAPCLVGGDVLWLDGDAQDYIHPGTETVTGGMWTAMSTPSSVVISMNEFPTFWTVEFETTQLGELLAAGFYDDAERMPFESAGHPGLSVYGDGKGCNMLTGKFDIVDVEFSGNTVTSITATFEQHCEGAAPALRGCVHYE